MEQTSRKEDVMRYAIRLGEKKALDNGLLGEPARSFAEAFAGSYVEGRIQVVDELRRLGVQIPEGFEYNAPNLDEEAPGMCLNL